jgi:2-methylcitrate dehydratase PrpD
MTAIALIHGDLTAQHYEDAIALDRRIDRLRAKMQCVENRQWSKDYLDPAKRSIANAVQVFFRDGTRTEKVAIEYPLGHRRRRAEGIPLLIDKFETNLARRFAAKQCRAIFDLCMDPKRLHSTPVNEFSDLFVI